MMTATPHLNLSANCTEFVPRGLNYSAQPNNKATSCYTPQAINYAPAQHQMPAGIQYADSFAECSSHALQAQRQPYQCSYLQQQYYAPPATSSFSTQQQLQQPVPEVQVNFNGVQKNVFQRQPTFSKETAPFYPNFSKTLAQRQCSSNKNVFMQPMPLLGKVQSTYTESSRTMTNSTNASSSCDSQSQYSDEEGFECIDMGNGFDSPVRNMVRKQSNMTISSNQRIQMLSASKSAGKTENGWKKKVKTELCRFWLNGQDCENSQKEQGCGFAHGQEELQKKKGLSRQYLTSVCKNFLEHPQKCTYGQRCIFQHPTFDVRKRQMYTDMMQDNARYTAMRLFQDIEDSEVIYINTYAATTPRLTAFKAICSSAKDNGEDYVDPADEDDSADSEPTFSRDLFRLGSQ